MEQQLIILQEYFISSPVFSGDRMLCFLCSVLYIIVWPFVFFLFAFVLRFTASDYLFGTFKLLFFHCICSRNFVYETKLLICFIFTSLPQFYVGVRVCQSFLFCVVFCRSLFVPLSIALSVLLWITASYYPFRIFVVCSSSIYGFWLPLWYLQTLL